MTAQAGTSASRFLLAPLQWGYSEISFPPLNLVMSVSGGCPDPKLFEVTSFKQFGYRERATVRLTLNNLAVNSYFPADYRTFEKLKSQVAMS